MKNTLSLTFFSLINTTVTFYSLTFPFSSLGHLPSRRKYIQKPILGMKTKHESNSLLEHVTRALLLPR